MHDLESAGADNACLHRLSELGTLGEKIGELRDTHVRREVAVALNGAIDALYLDTSLVERENQVSELTSGTTVKQHVHGIARRNDVGPDAPQVLGCAVQLIESAR